VSELLTAVGRADAKLLFLIPTLNPQGRVADLDTRRRLLDGLASRDVNVIEDLSSVDLLLEVAPPPLASLPNGADVISVGSMSKLFWGGLRVGFIRATPRLIGRLARLKARVDLGTPLLSQLLAARLLGDIENIRHERVGELRQQLAHGLEVVRTELPDLQVSPPAGGLSLWLELPRGTSTGLTEVAARKGVAVVAGAVLSHRGAADGALRVVYSRPPAVFDEGIRRLAVAWRSYSASTALRLVAPTDEPTLV
jgi:DNA-binding transcriptional MocR family regulator